MKFVNFYLEENHMRYLLSLVKNVLDLDAIEMVNDFDCIERISISENTIEIKRFIISV